MKVRGHTSDYTMRRAIRGAAIVVEHPRGYVVAQSWPRKRGPTKRPAEQANRDTFTQAMQVVKQMPPQSYAAAAEGARGTAFLPRDLMMMACYGLLVTAVTKDGRVIQGVRMVAKSIAAQLDQISATPGTMLIRSPAGWVAVPPGTEGQVLTYQQAEQSALWQDAAGPAAGGAGFWGSLITAVPSQANTGLTAWYNQTAGSTVADTDLGIALRVATNNSSVKLCGITGAAPAAPYTMRWLTFMPPGLSAWEAIGWSDGTKADVVLYQPSGQANRLIMATPTTVQSSSGLSVGVASGGFTWCELADDGTTVQASASADGVTFTTMLTITKAGSYLGSGGYTHLLFGCDAYNAPANLSLQAAGLL